MSVFDKEPVSVEVQGQVLQCVVCGHDEFHQCGAYFRLKALTLLLKFRDVPAECSICHRCGYVHWFLPK